jgi:DNA polymerase-3 subunit alpha
MLDSPDFYLKSSEEMEKLFADIPEAIENTVKIAEKCDVTIGTTKWILPKFDTPRNEKPEEYLRKLTWERVPTRFIKTTQEIEDRLNYELDVICTKGYATYFLIVQDFVNWAKNNGITVGPGRGSVAGSLVAYVLNITAINPLEMVIPFERFLNPHRPSPPDIDMDFADDRRAEVIAYVTKKYGEDRVAQIITFGTMEARAAIRDAGRALGMPYSAPDRIAKMIPTGAQGFSMNLEKALELSQDLKNAYDNEEETKHLIDLAKKLEGVSRHASVHAAGVVISDGPLTDYVPIQKETRFGKIITQYDMYSLDLNAAPDGQAVGLMKMDFLGLRNLSILEKTLNFVKKLHKVEIILNEIPLDDKQTFELIASGDTTGVFQLESAGMRRLGRNLKPNKFSDISAMVALYRPGPMQWIDEFIAGKMNPQKIRYPHPALKQVLSETYGIAVYQEQCMQIANVMAGYTMAEADRLRMAIGKKKKELMKKEHDAFIAGCAKQGYTQTVAEKVFSLIEKFVGYGFNKAHSACYGMIAYWTAYMKAHYPVEFMTALLTAESDASGPVREEKLRTAIEECRKMKISILPPDINKSHIEFSIENQTSIRFGLSAVKNVGAAAVNVILASREEQPFSSIYDLVSRVDLSKVNKKTMESLIKVGALDAFGSRAALLTSLSDMMAWVQKKKKDAQNMQGSLFGESTEEQKGPMLPKVEDFTKRELLNLEKELLGFYLTEHPLTSKMEKLQDQKFTSIAELNTVESGKKVRLPALVTRIKSILTKKNNSEMIFATIEDTTGTVDAVVFPTTYAKTRNFWYKDATLIISGSVNRRDDRLSVIVDNIYPLDV